MEQIEDKLLVEMFQRGSADAFAALYARHRPTILRQCLARLRDPHLAEDAAQDAFTRLLAALPTFQGGDKVERYLLRVARYACLDLAKARRTGPVPLDGLVDDLPTEVDVAHVCERRHSAALVLAAVTPRDAAMLSARHLDDRSTAEVARLFGLTAGSAAVLLSRARAAARHAAEARAIRGLLPLPLLPALLDRLRRTAVVTAPSALASALAAVTVIGGATFALNAPSERPPVQADRYVTDAATSDVATGERAGVLSREVGGGSPSLPDQQVASSSSGTMRSTAAPEVLTPLPAIGVPGAAPSIHQNRPADPDHAYGVVVDPGPIRFQTGVEVQGEQAQEPAHSQACTAVSATPVGYCEQ